MTRPRSHFALVAVVLAAAVSGCAAGASAPSAGEASAPGATAASARPGPSRADLYVAPRGSDRGRCTRARPCRTFARALARARPGDVVEIAGGRYPGQTLPAGSGPSRGKRVLFRPARGAKVELTGSLVVAASGVEVRDLAAPAWKVEGGRRIVLRRLDVNLFFIHGGRDVRVLGGDVGPTVDSDSQVTSADGEVPRKIRIVGVLFHDATKENLDTHIECLQFGAGIDVAVLNSRFRGCSDHGILVRSWASIGGSRHPLEHFRIQGNVIDKPTRGTYSIRLAPTNGWTCEDFLITKNVVLANMYSDCDNRNVRFVDNAQPSMSQHTCSVSKGATWEGNLYGAGVRCGRGDRVDPDAFGQLESKARSQLGV